MSCNCDSRLDSILKVLEEMKTEIGFVKKELVVVKSKCNRIEEEMLGITAESELNTGALMETTTVRHLVEKMSFDMDILTEEINAKARSEATRRKQLDHTSSYIHKKFPEVVAQKMTTLKQKYDVMTPKSFQKEFSNYLEEFRSQTEKVCLDLEYGLSSSIIHDMVQKVVGTADSDDLYKTHYPVAEYEEKARCIRKQYRDVSWDYARMTIGSKVDLPETELTVITEFLNKFKLCEESFASFRRSCRRSFNQ